MKNKQAGHKPSTKAATKDGPFPLRASKDGPFPMWTMVKSGSYGKDAPFPMLTGLYWERVSFQTLYQGNRGPKRPVQAAVKSRSDLPPTLSEIPIDVDFGQDEVIVVALGERPNNGYLAQIDQILYYTDRGEGKGPLTMVQFSEHKTTGVLDVVTYPVHVVKLRKLAGQDVEFVPVQGTATKH